ncbi:MAG TPA: rhamnogalacturonan acetylesterase [Pyrinomonadaceae bacterium]|nr:rhamnogalacturonan acetylesterase [Pyrinomonadaceae bacterium]
MKFVQLIITIFALQIAVNAQQVTVYLAGDSTMAQKQPDKRPETGWGEMIQQKCDETKVKIDNRAQNGRSTKSFIDEGRWKAIVDVLKKGDYVFIEFGHNDEKADKPAVYAAPNTDYRNNLIKFVNEVRAKKAFPILFTPVMRRKFDDKGIFQDTHGEYPDAVRKVAQELKVPLIDMHRLSETVLKKLGVEESRTLFLQLKPNENANYPKGVEDNTHFNPKGAEIMANLAIDEIRKTKIGLKKFLKK